MSPFEFFFSFYGLVLGLSVAVIATGLATAIQHRRTVRIGRLTPLLAGFVGLDIASFWDTAWTSFRDVQYSYGLLIAGLVIAVVYFLAASLVFPHQIRDGLDLDDHFWANRRPALLLMILANTLLVLATMAIVREQPRAGMLVANYAITWALYVALILPAALARRPAIVSTCIALHAGIYVLIALFSFAAPEVAVSGHEPITAPAPPADRARP